LLAGETLTLEGKQFTLHAIGIAHPATERVPIAMGVSGPMLLQPAGEIADTTLLAASAGIEHFRFARAQVERGLAKSGRAPGDMAYSTIALTCVDRDGPRARAAARPILGSFLGEFGVNTMTDAYGISDQLTAILERTGPDAVAAEMPDDWLEDLTPRRHPAEVADKIRRWLDAGLDSICIFQPDAVLEETTIHLVAGEVIPIVRKASR
jgi:5,10-methylenetetrahydromethanopterin reductase